MTPDPSSPSGPEPCPNCSAPIPAHAPQGLCPNCLFARLAAQTDDGAGATAQEPPLTPEELAPHFPQLEILECLGRGGMGVVYKARQKSLNRFVALKLLAPERVEDAKFAQRFTHEAQALAALNHPNIVTIHDFGQAGGFYFLLMEFVDGVNLRQAMKAGRFAPEQALAVVPPVCEALQYAHEHGIVHRDIKPENLLLDKEGRVKIADFGIAKMLGDTTAGVNVAESQPAGTPQYMAPEQKEHQVADHRADIYSLGVVLYELLTGELPADKLQPPSSRPRGLQIDVRLDEIVLRALEKTPELRYQTAGEFRTQVETMTGRASGPPVQPPEVTEPSRFSRNAIVGACWVIFFFAVVPAFIAHEMETHEFWRHGPFASVLVCFVWFVFVIPGFIAPLGATLLGWIAATQIRRSAGKLYGLWLAVCDGLFFPLLVLDVLIWDVASRALILFSNWQAHAISQQVRQSASDPVRTFELITQLDAHHWLQDVEWDLFRFVVLAVVVVVDWLIIRAVWRAVSGSSVLPTRKSALGKKALVAGIFTAAVCLIIAIFAPRGATQATNASAAQETWSPALTPGAKPDLQQILSEAQALAGSGRYEEALQRHLWFHYHSLEFDPAFSGVRLSFALSYWVELGKHYPKARLALIEIRDAGARDLGAGHGDFALFQEFDAINENLQELNATYPLFKTMAAVNQTLAHQCYPLVEDRLMQRGEYEDCLAYIGDPQARFESLRKIWEVTQKVSAAIPASQQDELRSHTRQRFVADTCRLIEILVATHRQSEAEKIRDQAVATLDDARLKSAVADAEQRIRRKTPVPAASAPEAPSR
ncbi:MAG: serine/threonine-protein kinase [Chthoniobacter sp.]|uniref:serine/threonine-protein kinase n=1 Tax=Chthoniobacter sp. TaxID=2510640 RepID=UPI0032AD3944